MSVLHPTPLSTRQLTYLGGGRFVTEMSSISQEPSQVYDDACDIGFTLVSEKTGRQKVVALERTERQDGEIVAHDFVEIDRRTGQVVLAAPVRLRVFND